MLRRDRDLFEDSLLTYTNGLSPDSGSGAVRRLRPFGRKEAELRVSLRGAAVRFLFVFAFTVLTHSPVAAWLRGVRTRQRGDVSNWFIFNMSTDVLVIKRVGVVGGGFSLRISSLIVKTFTIEQLSSVDFSVPNTLHLKRTNGNRLSS